MNKYCVKGCKELAEWTRNYQNDICNVRGNNTEGYYYLQETHENFTLWNHESRIPEGYTLLSFEEFKRIVLDGNSEEQNFNIWD